MRIINNKTALLAVIVVLVLSYCSTKTSEQAKEANESAEKIQQQVTLYGSNSCDHCTVFRAGLDSAGVTYAFYDVEQNETYANEMLAKVHSVNYYDYIQFPVVVVGENVFINPPLDKVLALLK